MWGIDFNEDMSDDNGNFGEKGIDHEEFLQII